MRLSSVLACLAILHLPGLPAGGQQGTAPAPGQFVVLGADGQPAGGASVTVLLPGRGGVSPADEILVRSGTADDGVVEAAVPRLHGLTLVIDHPAHLPFVGQYPDQAPPNQIRLQVGRTSKGVVRESGSGRTVAGAEVCVAWPGLACPTGSAPCGAARKAGHVARSNWRACLTATSRRRPKRLGSKRTSGPSSRVGGPRASSSSSWPGRRRPRKP